MLGPPGASRRPFRDLQGLQTCPWCSQGMAVISEKNYGCEAVYGLQKLSDYGLEHINPSEGLCRLRIEIVLQVYEPPRLGFRGYRAYGFGLGFWAQG